jgi:hypothetical protein
LENEEPVALYVDADGNDKPSDDERIAPVAPPEGSPYGGGSYLFFYTGDLRLPAGEGGAAPYRFVLRVRRDGTSTPMWSSSCVWEGRAELGGVPHGLVLLDGGTGEGFQQFGRASFSLFPVHAKAPRKRFARNVLSRIVLLEDGFHTLRFLGRAGDAGGFKAVLEPYTGEVGTIAFDVKGPEALQARMEHSYLEGDPDRGVCFSLSAGGREVRVPVGAYTVKNAGVNYGTANGPRWRFTLSEYGGVAVEGGATNVVEIGSPELTVLAIDRNRRYASDAEPATAFDADTTVYLWPEVKGPHGESYGRFSRRNGRKWVDAEPTVRIVDAEGVQVASAAMEYG